MIKRHLQQIADIHKVEYSEVLEMFKITIKWTVLIIMIVCIIFFIGFYVGYYFIINKDLIL